MVYFDVEAQFNISSQNNFHGHFRLGSFHSFNILKLRPGPLCLRPATSLIIVVAEPPALYSGPQLLGLVSAAPQTRISLTTLGVHSDETIIDFTYLENLNHATQPFHVFNKLFHAQLAKSCI